MSGPDLKRVFDELIDLLGGQPSEVYLRTYSEGSANVEAGESPRLSYSDALILPQPIVVAPRSGLAEALGEIANIAKGISGHRIFIMSADTPAEVGRFLVEGGTEYEITRLEAPILFRKAQLKVALARKVIK